MIKLRVNLEHLPDNLKHLPAEPPRVHPGGPRREDPRAVPPVAGAAGAGLRQHR